MILNRLLLLLLTYFIGISSILAQEHLFEIEVIGVEDGLPEREIHDIIVDKKGYLWMSTQGAISRYDGNQFKTYTYQQLNINEYHFTELAVDADNNIWYVEIMDVSKKNHSGVINSVQDSVYTVEEYTNGLFNSNEIINLNTTYQDHNKWFLTNRAGIFYEYKNGNFDSVFTLNDTPTASIYFEPNGSKENWVLNRNKAVRLINNEPKDSFQIDIEHFHFSNIIRQQPSLVLKGYSSIHGDSYWEYQEGQLLPFTLANQLPYQQILQLEQDFNTFLVNDTLFIRNDNQQLLFKQKNPLGEKVGKTLYLKQQDILLVGSANGILKITRQKNPFQEYYKGQSIRGLFAEKDNLWISGGQIKNKQIHLPTMTANELFLNAPTDKFSFDFTCPYRDTKQRLWFGTDREMLIRYKEQEQAPSYYYQEKDHGIHFSVPFENKETKKIWIGTNIGLSYFDEVSQQILPFDLPINKDIAVRHLYQNEKGIWILTSEGIFLMDAHTETILKHYTQKDGFSSTNFMHLHEDIDGIFWLATKGGGLIRWDISKNTIQQFTKQQGLSHNVLYAVYEDDYENLWIPSNYGLMQFDKMTFDTKVFLPQNGLPHEEFNTFAHAQAADGTLYFGGLNGAIGFHPKIFQTDTTNYTPSLRLTSVKVLEAEASEFKYIGLSNLHQNGIELAPDYQTLEIELSYLDYASSKTNEYAYQIEGYQNNWIYTKDNVIPIFKLPYGRYQVKLKAKGASGIWTNEIVTFPLIIKTPFYLQGWFLFIMTSLGILGIIAIIKKREINLQRDKERLELEIKKRTATIVKQTEELKALDKAKTLFFSNITHEFRTPLTLVLGPLQKVIKDFENTTIASRLTGVLKNAQQLLHLINQLLDISKLESSNMKVEISHGDIVPFTQELIDGFKEIAKEKNQRLVFHTKQGSWKTHFDKDKWHKIIYNVVFNAVKFTPSNGAIQLSLTKIINQDSEWIHLKIKDSGIGITENRLPQVFNRFYQINDSGTYHPSGTGIGLALVKELVKLQHGEISVTSKVNLGTTFDIKIPIPKVAPSEIIENKTSQSDLIIPMIQGVQPITTIANKSSNKKYILKILLIEDNPEMLRYIKSCLDNKKYNIYTSLNGVEGLAKAKALIPDLIVSDVMMPLKNGFEVTYDIRENTATSHIPIILLTAKATLSSKLKGLERGADAYLTKPFSPEELAMRIQSLIELRQLLQKRYQNDNFAIDQKKTAYQKEDKFIHLIRRIITDNIESTELNGEMIAKKTNISRMQLHRKIKALTNQSTSKFIQHVRLEIAYELIKEQSYNVTEITYKTGFVNPNHFSRVFKEKYGKAPSQILN